MTNKKTTEHFKGCILGGAIGDALGAAIEFMSIDQIRSSYGDQGLIDYSKAYGRNGAIAYNDSEKAFHFGCKLAALTHGHPTGYLAAGTFAALISLIVSGNSLAEAIEDSILILKSDKNHGETLTAIGNALDIVGKHTPEPEVIENIGAGWIAEEALAISLYCSLTAAEDFKKGVLLAVNHSGDSDSTGSITGNILGSLYGMDIIPEKWLADLELKELIEETAGDLYEQFG